MDAVDLVTFATGGMFREQEVRAAVERFDWAQYRGQDVLIKGCGSMPVPQWVYLIVTARLVAAGANVFFGEAAKPISIFTEHKSASAQEHK